MKILQRFYYLVFIVFTFQFLFSCSSIKNINYYLSNPVGAIKIDENFFCDETEIANIHWAEYVYWLKSIFGDTSKEYKASLPDTLVWRVQPFNLEPYVELYFRHPAFSRYPVVGITQQQATDYSKWRSDRVLESTLIFYGKIKSDRIQNKDNYFTIDRYFSGHLMYIKPDTNFIFYPEYRLPTVGEWKKIIRYNDSIQKHVCREFQADVDEYKINGLDTTPTRSIYYSPCGVRKNKSLYNLRGNVREWTSEKDISAGGGWKDKSEIILSQDTFHSKERDYLTGFRNVCEWKKWKKWKK